LREKRAKRVKIHRHFPAERFCFPLSRSFYDRFALELAYLYGDAQLFHTWPTLCSIYTCMNAKPTTGAPSADQQTEMADPTRSILKCVELRKRKAAETQLIIVRLRAIADGTARR
jgi:hypothetical protein